MLQYECDKKLKQVSYCTTVPYHRQMCHLNTYKYRRLAPKQACEYFNVTPLILCSLNSYLSYEFFINNLSKSAIKSLFTCIFFCLLCIIKDVNLISNTSFLFSYHMYFL